MGNNPPHHPEELHAGGRLGRAYGDLRRCSATAASSSVSRANVRKGLGGNMRGRCVVAGIASAGLVVASLVMGAPANARGAINGTSGPDHLRGTPHSDTIRGFGGNDKIRSLAGPDVIFGGSGVDFVAAGRGDDTIRRSPGRDFFAGRPGDDTIHGGYGRDELEGDGGADVLFGGPSRDFFSDDHGADTIHAGLGNDKVSLDADTSVDTVTCGPGHDVVIMADRQNTVADDCEVVDVRPV